MFTLHLCITGAQKLSAHLQDALAELQSVREQENPSLQRRVDLCCGELEDQIAELERTFQQKVYSLLDTRHVCGGGSEGNLDKPCLFMQQ